jgi:predicted acyl esterase
MLLVAWFLLLVVPITAQDLPAPEVVSISASDGLELRGDFYRPAGAEEDTPAVLLMHMLGSQRNAYEPLLPDLLDAGYIVLNIDLRGHGETGGRHDWELAVSDVQTLLDWLRQQEGVADDQIAIIGASVGSNLALVGCANDEACVTAIALSPGLDYRGIEPQSAVTEGLAERSALLIASHQDGFSADSVIVMFSEATGNVAARLYEGRAHGTALFNNELASVSSAILSWLDEQFAAVGE